jgi:hypothetical protein
MLVGNRKLYKHETGVNTNFILDGASGKDDIKEYLDFQKILQRKIRVGLCLFCKQSTGSS